MADFEWRTIGRHYWMQVGGVPAGMVYESTPGKFAAFLETPDGLHPRKHLCYLPTLDEAKALLQTVVASQL